MKKAEIVKLRNGELITKLNPENIESSEFDDRVYSSLQQTKAESNKCLKYYILSLIIAIMAYFNVITNISNSGIEITPSIFDHVALIALSLSAGLYAVSYYKVSFLKSWFNEKYELGTPSQKANYLLLYPEAFVYIKFFPISIGSPEGWHHKTIWPIITSILIILLSSITYLVSLLIIWLLLVYEVFISKDIPSYISYLTIFVSTLAVVSSINKGYEQSNHTKFIITPP